MHIHNISLIILPVSDQSILILYLFTGSYFYSSHRWEFFLMTEIVSPTQIGLPDGNSLVQGTL